MSTETDLPELGPIDYLVLEWPHHKPTGEPFAELLKLVEGGVVRILDLAFVRKNADGEVVGLTLAEAADGVAEIEVFEGAASGLIGDEDYEDIAATLEADEAAAIILYENLWAHPFAAAVRRSGGQLVASGRIPHEDVVAALEV